MSSSDASVEDVRRQWLARDMSWTNRSHVWIPCSLGGALIAIGATSWTWHQILLGVVFLVSAVRRDAASWARVRRHLLGTPAEDADGQ